MKTCGNCQWQHNGNCRRTTWGLIEQVSSIESSYNVTAWWGYAGKDDPACPEWVGIPEEKPQQIKPPGCVCDEISPSNRPCMVCEAHEDIDIFIIKRQTQRIEELRAELQAAYDLLAKENRNG